MKKIKLFTLALAALFAGNVSAEETLFYTDFASEEWVGHEAICNGSTKNETVNGIYFMSDNTSKQYTIADGVLTFPDNNMGNKYFLAIPVQNVNEKLIVTITTASAGQRVSYIFRETNEISASSVSGTATPAADNTDGSITLTYQMKGTGTEALLMLGRQGSSFKSVIKAIKITTPTPPAVDDATLSAITIAGEALEGFDAETTEYNVELPFGTTEVPAVVATTTSKKATAVVTAATAIPGATTIVVTAEDKTTTKTYTINFTAAQNKSEDATLSALTINGKGVSGFKADSLNYKYEVAYKGEFPVVAATANDETATVAITQIIAFPGTATVVVTAQAGNTLTYTIDFTIATAPKILTEVVFSNGAKGAALDGVVRVPYLAGQEVPTIVSFTTNEGSTGEKAEDGNSITVTSSEDNTTLVYTVKAVELTPAALGTEEVTFTGEETYVFDPYGWDASKGWKFAKTVEDAENRRVSEGRTRIYMALPAAKEVILTSGTGGARAIKVFVNGVEKTEITSTAGAGKTITIALDSKNANFLAVESNQTKGDGGFSKIQLVPAGETAIDNAVVAEKAQKMIINGQLVIVKDGVSYNAQGVQL